MVGCLTNLVLDNFEKKEDGFASIVNVLQVALLSILLVGLIVVFSYTSSFSFFKDSAGLTSNMFTAAESFPPTSTPSATPTLGVTPSPTPTTNHIVINEVSAIGGNDVDWVELFNPTNSAVDLTGWKVVDNTGTDIFPGTPILSANSYAVIVASGSGVVIPGSALKIELSTVTIGAGLAPAGDRVILRSSIDTDIDAMSYGTNTTIFILPAITTTLIRNPNGVDTNTASDWIQSVSSSIGVGN